jgi:hypothetical protein
VQNAFSGIAFCEFARDEDVALSIPSLDSPFRRRDETGTNEFGLHIQGLGPKLLSLRAVGERVKVDRTDICAGRGCMHDTSVPPVLCRCTESGRQQLREQIVTDDVRPELQVEAVFRDLLDGWDHHARVVEEDMELGFRAAWPLHQFTGESKLR